MNQEVAHARTADPHPSMGANSHYVFGFLTAALAVAVCVWLTPLLGDHAALITIFAAVMFATRYLGIRPAIVALAASLLGIWFWIPAPDQTSIHKIFEVVAFLLCAGDW